jgi:Phage integrase, N-terminal SAM-like domain
MLSLGNRAIALPPLPYIGALAFGECRVSRRETATKKLSPEQNGSKNSYPFSTEYARRLSRRRYQHGQLLQIEGNRFGRFYIDEIVDGKLRRYRPQVFLGGTTDFPTKRLALRELEKRLFTINDPRNRPRPTVTFAEFACKWEAIVVGQLEPSSEQNYKVHLRKHLVPFFGPQRMKDIDSESLQHFVASLRGSPKTIRNIVVTLKSLWRSARSWHYVTHDIFDGLVYPTPQRTQRFFFSLEHVQRIFRSAEEPPPDVLRTFGRNGYARR